MISTMALFGAFVTGLLCGSCALFAAFKFTMRTPEGCQGFFATFISHDRGQRAVAQVLADRNLEIVPVAPSSVPPQVG